VGVRGRGRSRPCDPRCLVVRLTPRSLRSSAVRLGNTRASISLSRNACSYRCSPRPRSHAAISALASLRSLPRWLTVPLIVAARGYSARLEPTISPDSLLEGSGFEPSVPLPRLSSIRAVRAEIRPRPIRQSGYIMRAKLPCTRSTCFASRPYDFPVRGPFRNPVAALTMGISAESEAKAAMANSRFRLNHGSRLLAIEGPESAHLARCRTTSRRSLPNPICRPSPWCIAGRDLRPGEPPEGKLDRGEGNEGG
jgi:hypothetical protein